jgi:hypothetical protein
MGSFWLTDSMTQISAPTREGGVRLLDLSTSETAVAGTILEMAGRAQGRTSA